eukprot:234149-Prymnesium_polylepis.1
MPDVPPAELRQLLQAVRDRLREFSPQVRCVLRPHTPPLTLLTCRRDPCVRAVAGGRQHACRLCQAWRASRRVRWPRGGRRPGGLGARGRLLAAAAGQHGVGGRKAARAVVARGARGARLLVAARAR